MENSYYVVTCPWLPTTTVENHTFFIVVCARVVQSYFT